MEKRTWLKENICLITLNESRKTQTIKSENWAVDRLYAGVGLPVLLGENEEKRTGHMIVRPRLLYIIDFMSWYSLWDFFEFSAIAFHMMVINMVAVKKSSRDWDRFLHSIYLFWITRVNKDLYT